jgi:hypothetical protein
LAEEIWRERLDERLRQPRTHRVAGWDAMQNLLIDYDGSWNYPIAPDHHLRIDSAQPVDQLVQTVIHHLAQAT